MKRMFLCFGWPSLLWLCNDILYSVLCSRVLLPVKASYSILRTYRLTILQSHSVSGVDLRMADITYGLVQDNMAPSQRFTVFIPCMYVCVKRLVSTL